MSDEARDWPLRAASLALAGAGVGLAVHFLVTGDGPSQPVTEAWRLALAALLTTAGLAVAFVLERQGHRLTASFAGAAGLIVGSVVYWNGPSSGWDAGEGWRLTCALLTVAIAAPLFQAWRDAGAARTIPYVAAHDRAWTNVVLWFAAMVFTGITWLLAMLLGELFALIGVRFIEELLRKDWFAAVLTGGAFGGAIGLLRDRERVLGTLQRVVTTVLSVLAPALAVGLLAFLIALPFTGLSPLWAATRSTTPILIGCVIGALILANAVLGDRPEHEARRGVLRWSAMGLGLALLPLGVIAAISTGLRIAQYGLTPERLWAVVFTGIACAYCLAYLVALVRARGGWGEPVRAANLRLGLALCVLAFILSTPLLSFNQISTRDQLARLADGRTPPAKFDWAALRFDFGEAGKAAVARLAREGSTSAIRIAASETLKSDNRYAAREDAEARERADTLDARIRILPKSVPLPAWLRTSIARKSGCELKRPCGVLFTSGATEAFIVSSDQWGEEVQRVDPSSNDKSTPIPKITEDTIKKRRADEARRQAVLRAAIERGDVEVRTVQRRQVFINGEPVGSTFE
ncbi:DUF4153 domain-containing protein [Glacieibacterium frigidum]|uniref:DUF4153 domain-containing protein n=1 Tax=Glacieibacterium frigidum TaxID=2593303 RepID=A0A552UGW2_9SPHN|nr:DUF4153 domain-containing protein [Glacieibacterium frigidum]TRW17462.1 DUF4153 domain-containing protein [Glacieibacterium frigidum]